MQWLPLRRQELGESRMNLLVGEGDQESGNLHLPLVVEAQHADEAVGVSLLALLDLSQHLAGVVAPEHGQLPHGPVASIVVAGSLEVVAGHAALLVEFQAGNEVLADHELHLLCDLLIAQWGQVRQSLELEVVVGVPHLRPLQAIPFFSIP